MFVRADISVPMEGVNLVDHAVLVVVESANTEIFVRMELHASETDVLSLSFLLVEPAKTEMFARLDISVSTVGAIEITSVLVECVRKEMFVTWVTLVLMAYAHCLTLEVFPQVETALIFVTGAFLDCSANQVHFLEVIVGLANK